MKIHKEGYSTIPITLLLVLLVGSPCFYLLGPTSIWSYILYLIGGVFMGLVVYFFRVPNRTANAFPNQVLAPADGKVVVIERVVEKEYFKDERIQVSIFMSPLNVHVNWDPIAGTISYTKYHKGKFLVAWHPKSSELNERSTVVIRNSEYGEILVRQIAGAVARRIRTYNKTGDHVGLGTELGFIKFGSRVDLLLPLNADINVEPGQTVVGLESVIAEFAQ